jgi:4-amino-4-deoxy-L-arabinose transferase-like glycosyltransferase
VLASLRASIDQPTLDRLVLVVLVVLAAGLRLVDLTTRGTWDADQGHDMLVLRALVQSGEVPLLGPPTSIGDFHHGVLYYYLLAPAAALSGADPVAVVAAIALAGVAAVAVTWWLARAIGGPVAGAVAGLLMAVSASAVDESTFIWNPNLIALSSSVAIAAAWRAWTGGRARWWVVAGLGIIVTMHCHVLGSVLLPPVLGLWIADLRRLTPGEARSARLRAGIVAGLLLVVSYVPLAIHEVTRDFSETRAALDFVAGGGEGSATALPLRLVIVGLRVIAWPLTGLLTDAPLATLLAAGLVIGLLAWRVVAATGAERTAARWFAATLAWTIAALTVLASGLATVIPGLPNDHYHAFADPIVFVIVGLGAAALARWRPGVRGAPARESGAIVGTIAASALVAVLVIFNLSRQPPAVVADGGWPAGQLAAERVLSVADSPISLESIPEFKSADAMRFPLIAAGAHVNPASAGPVPAPSAASVVVLCDSLFEEILTAACGGPAEDQLVSGRGLRLADRFEAAPGRWVSVYLVR